MVSISWGAFEVDQKSLKAMESHYLHIKQKFRTHSDIGLDLPPITGDLQKSLRMEKNKAEKSILEKDPGLKLIGGYKQDLMNDVYKVDNDDNSSFTLGLQYNLFKSGWYSRKDKIAKLQQSIDQDSLFQARENFLAQCEAVKQQNRVRVELNRAWVQQQKQWFYDHYDLFDKDSYLAGGVPKNKFLEILLKKKFQQMNRDKKSDSLKTETFIPVYRIDLKHADSVVRKHTEIYYKSLSADLDHYSLIENTSLNFYLKGAYYPNYAVDQNDIVAGVSFTMPLRRTGESIKDFEKKRTSIISKNIEHSSNAEQTLFLTKAENYNRQLEQAALSHYRLLELEENIESVFERLKSTSVLKKDAMQLYVLIDKWYSALDRDILIRGLSYKKMMDVLVLSGSPDVISSLVPMEFKESVTEILHAGYRALYVHKKEFEKYPLGFFIQFCKVKNIKKVILSHSRKMDDQKVKRFIELAHTNQLEVELMYSNTEWALKENHEKAIQRINEGLLMEPDGIHLDVEPHIMDNWRGNNFALLDDFVGLLKEVRSIHRLQFSVSVPVIFPKEYYPQIMEKVDDMHVMIYGKRDVAKVEKKLSELFEEKDYKKIFVAVRCTDFADELLLEEYVQGLHGNKKFGRFSLFDLGRYQEVLLR